MRIFHSVASLDPSTGGPARSVPQLALASAQRGMKIGLWSPQSAHGPLADLTSDESQQIQILSGDFSNALDSFGAPDLVHDHGIWHPCHREVARVCQSRGISRIVSTRGMLEPWALNHKKWKKKLAWWIYQKTDLQPVVALHATAEQEADQLKKLGLKPPLFLLPNGVALPNGRFEQDTKTDGVKTALFLGRTHPIKGLPMWVEVWKRVMPAGWKMRVVGPDEDGHREEVQSMLEQRGLSDSWSFEDSLQGEAKWQAMASADLFVLPTHSENFGIVVAEALASWTPVLTTKGAPWQGLQTHDCGWWVDPTVEGLEKGFREALSRIDDFPEMGERARSWVERDFGWEEIAEKMRASYEWVLGKGPKPHCVI